MYEPAPVKSYTKDQTIDHVFDMVGNLRELCADAYVPYTELPLARNSPRKTSASRRGKCGMRLVRKPATTP